MKFTRLSLAVLAATGLATTGFAQDTSTPDVETPAEVTEDAVVDAAENATPVTDAAPTDLAQNPEELSVEKFGDWEVRCTLGRENCFMYQLAHDPAGNPVTEVTLLNLPAGGEAAAGATVVTPLGTLLTKGLIMQIDAGQARKYDYSWCLSDGCFARFGLTPDYLANMKRGNVAKIRLFSVSAPDRPVDATVSLTGFTAAFDALTKPAAE